jgi:GTP-binding protein HflX
LLVGHRFRRLATGEYRMQEMGALAASAGAIVVGTVTGRRARPDAALFAGKGKVDEVDALRRANRAPTS